MSAELQILRQCKDCPEWTHTVCCFAFGKFWRDKSRNGEGCTTPLDDVAESWRKAGWTPGGKPKAKIALPMDEKPEVPPPKAVKKQTSYSQTSLFAASRQKAAEPLPLTDDDY